MSTLAIGSSTIGRAFAIASRNALARGDEGNLLGIHRVVLAVVDDHTQVLDGISGDGAGVEHLAHALLHRRDELRGDDAAFHLVHELEARASRKRLDSQIDLAELARATGLLLVAAMAFGLAVIVSR